LAQAFRALINTDEQILLLGDTAVECSRFVRSHDVTGDGHICVKEVKGNGNHGGGVSHKDNNWPL
jgi:hypothetical protein